MHPVKSFIKRTAFGAVPLVGLFLCMPVKTAQGQFSMIFSALMGTVTGMGGSMSSIGTIQSGYSSLVQGTLFPLSGITSAQGFMSTMNSSYGPWMSEVMSTAVNSATLPQSQALETQLLSGNSNSIDAVQPNYQATYGTVSTTTAAVPAVQQQQDIGDAIAQDSQKLAISSDQTAQALVAQAQTLSQQASTVAPGNPDLITAQALALQLQSLSYQHKLLAAQLREEGANVANVSASMKQAATSTQNVQQIDRNLQTGVNR